MSIQTISGYVVKIYTQGQLKNILHAESGVRRHKPTINFPRQLQVARFVHRPVQGRVVDPIRLRPGAPPESQGSIRKEDQVAPENWVDREGRLARQRPPEIKLNRRRHDVVESGIQLILEVASPTEDAGVCPLQHEVVAASPEVVGHKRVANATE